MDTVLGDVFGVVVTLLGITVIIFLILMMVSAIFDVPRYEVRNWIDRRRLDRAVRVAKEAADREAAHHPPIAGRNAVGRVLDRDYKSKSGGYMIGFDCSLCREKNTALENAEAARREWRPRTRNQAWRI